MVTTAFCTGMRRVEILSLTWNKVDLTGRMIRLESTDIKEGLSKKVPISKNLRNILKKLPIGSHNDYVFLFRGKPVRDIRDGLMRVCKTGVDKNVRAVIFGHGINGDMDSRYDHLDESDSLDAIDRTEVFLRKC